MIDFYHYFNAELFTVFLLLSSFPLEEDPSSSVFSNLVHLTSADTTETHNPVEMPLVIL